jgi:Ca2+-transporting ATPase
MLKDNNLVRVLAACETMGNATDVCCDKTGTLTMNKMTVMAGILGTKYRFKFSSDEVYRDQPSPVQEAPDSESISIHDSLSMMSAEFRKILSQSIVINSTTFETETSDGTPRFVGSMTETALLSFAKERLGIGSVDVERAKITTVQIIPFDSRRKCMVTVIRLSKDTYRLCIKGAPEILLEKCTQMIMDATGTTMAVPITRDNSLVLTDSIREYADQSLRTIGFAYRDFDIWPPPEARLLEGQPNEIVFEDIKNLTFLGVFGIQDPLRPGVKDAVAKCQHAGVCVRMVTGDNIGTARSIAAECGILSEDGVVMEGAEFRRLSERQMNQVLPQLEVLARSSPEDKRILVKRLKELGDIVAVTGDGTNDGPALRAADVGFSMGVSGTEVAKEASSIVLIDDNFSSIVKAIEWGRTVNDAIRKFLQVCLQSLISFVSSLANHLQVPTYCQHYRCYTHICFCYRQRQGTIYSHAGSIALGQSYNGHICCSRTSYRSSEFSGS